VLEIAKIALPIKKIRWYNVDYDRGRCNAEGKRRKDKEKE